MSSERILAVIAAVNTLLQFLRAAGLTYADLAAAVRRAEEAGRPFGPEDLAPFRERAQAAVARLDATLAAPPAPPPVGNLETKDQEPEDPPGPAG